MPSTTKAKPINAIDFLVADHRAASELFKKFESAKGSDAQAKIVKDICTALTIHTRIEEEIFYPALRDKIDADDLDEAYVEHDSAKVLIRDLGDAYPDEDFYKAKVSVLKEQIEHHVEEEEMTRIGLFAQVKKTDVDLDELGRRLAERQAELMTLAERGELPPPKSKTLVEV
jgi:hemerythrin-like domain-containing protein